MDNIREIIKKNKKRIAKIILISFAAVIAICGTGAITLYNIAKSNINYTVEEAKQIALQMVPGEVLKVNKCLELDNFSFEYRFKIKTSNNYLMEVNVDSNLGVVTEVDNYFD